MTQKMNTEKKKEEGEEEKKKGGGGKGMETHSRQKNTIASKNSSEYSTPL